MSTSDNDGKTYKDRIRQRIEEASTVRKIVAIVVASLILIIAIGGISGYFYVKSALQPVDPESSIDKEVEIPMGSSTSHIATILEEKGIIKDSRVFRFYIKFNNESNFKAGKYQLSPAMTLNEIVGALKTGTLQKEPSVTITIPEGKTIDQIAELYANKAEFSKEEFLTKINNTDFVQKLIDLYPSILTEEILNPEIRISLEGYLFAATYSFYQESPSIEKIVKKMLKKTESIVAPYRDQISARDMTVHEAITMATLVENEARTKEERRKIAGVFYNRIEEGMKLQTDPTVLYALGEHKDRVLYEDLEVKSPYNTYYIKGLPVGPISNFAENSLVAVLKPKNTDYKYFVAGDDGNIYYSKTHEKHLELKEKHLN